FSSSFERPGTARPSARLQAAALHPALHHRGASRLAELTGEDVEQLVRSFGDVDVAGFDPALEVVEEHDGRDGDEKTEGRRDERFGHTGRNGAETARARGRHALERIDDTHVGSEEADERRRGADGAENALSALHPLRFALRLPLERTRYRLEHELGIAAAR